MIPVLLEAGAGASIDLRNRDGDSALTLACRGRIFGTIPLLLRAGADYNVLFKKVISENNNIEEMLQAKYKSDITLAKLLVEEIQKIRFGLQNILKGGCKNKNYLKKYLKYKSKYSQLKNNF